MSYTHIKEYSDNPKWMFHHHHRANTRKPEDGCLYFGWELEFEASERYCSEPLESIAKEIKSRYKWLWVKRDGSLRNGFEIVSHPGTAAWHFANQKNVDELYSFLKSKGMFCASLFGSGEGGNAHIHMNRSFFDNDEQIVEYERLILAEMKKPVGYDGLQFGNGSDYCKWEKNPCLLSGCARYFAVAYKQSTHTIEVRCLSDSPSTISDSIRTLAGFVRQAKYGQENK